MNEFDSVPDEQTSSFELGISPSLKPSFEIGVTRLFGTEDINDAGKKGGWSLPEDAHNWNDGLEADFELTTTQLDAPYELEFEGEPFINQACPSQDIVLYVNGFRTGFWRLTEARPYTLSVRIEPEQLFKRDGLVLVKCAWMFPNGTRPVEKGLSSDTRILAFCFRSLSISKAA